MLKLKMNLPPLTPEERENAENMIARINAEHPDLPNTDISHRRLTNEEYVQWCQRNYLQAKIDGTFEFDEPPVGEPFVL